MATANCKPTAEDSWAGQSFPDWELVGDTTAVACLSTKDDSKYIRVQEDTADTTPDFTAHDFSGVPSGATINSVSIYWKRTRAGTPTGKARWNVKLGASTTNGTYGKSIDSKLEVVARPGGGSWAYADLASLKVNFQSDGTGTASYELRYDEYYLVVDYAGGGGLAGYKAYTGAAGYGGPVGGTGFWLNGRIANNTNYPNYSASVTTPGTLYWRAAVSTDTTFSAPVYSSTLSIAVPAGTVTNNSLGAYAKVTSLTTDSTYYYRVQIATDTATWTDSEDTYQSFSTLTATAPLAVASMTSSAVADNTAPTNVLATATVSTYTNAKEWTFDFGDGYTTSYLGPTGGLVAVTANKTAGHVYTTNSTFTLTFTATGIDTTATGTTTLAIVAPVITATYSLSTVEDTSGTVRKVSVTLTDNSIKNNTTSTLTRTRDIVDPLEQRLWTITKPGTVTETFTDNPLYVTYGTESTDIGYYGVSLTVTSVYGFVGTVASTQAFGVGYLPVDATFTALGNRVGYNPLTVSFSNGSIGSGLSYLWSFGDSGTSTSTATTVTHTYVTSGAYTVALTATGSTLTGTSSDTASRASYVVVMETTGTENAGGLLREIQWHLLEDPTAPPCSAFSVFGGSDEVLACLNRRLKHYVAETEIIQTETTLAADTSGVYPLPSNMLKLKRVEVAGYPVKPLDQHQADFAQAAWEATTTGDILGYVWKPEDNLSLRFVPKIAGLTVTVDYVAAPATVTEPAGCYGWALLPIPRVLAWGVKWGVIADLLNKEGEMNDPVRAKFAEDMYLLSIDLAKMLITRRRQG
jgi:PKD repeat protein